VTREALRTALGQAMAGGVVRKWGDEEFNLLALEIFRYQARTNPVYGAFVQNRGIDPNDISGWMAIPAVPARAFKDVPLFCGDPALVKATFLTSGTTSAHRSGSGRGRHQVRDLSLYRESLLSMARVYLHPEVGVRDGGEAAQGTLRGAMHSENRGGSAHHVRLIALLPPPALRPESSLVHMAGVLKEEWDDGKGGFFASADWALDLEGVVRALRRANEDGVAVLLIGTAFGLVHLLDETEGNALPPLPSGSVLMETGGYKGRSRELPRQELYGSLSSRLGIPLGRIVNEYGMTEMLSQFYEPVLSGEAPDEVEGRWHEGPPWVRTQILDPSDLTPVPVGEPGLLCHYDLANLDSVSAILTEDWGVEVGKGFRVLGRLVDAEPRGCSVSMEELLAARGGSRG